MTVTFENAADMVQRLGNIPLDRICFTPPPGTATMRDLRALYRTSMRLFDAVRQCPRPVIAAVNGAAAGGGNELVIACDLAIATQSATFGQTGPRVGSSPVTGATNVVSEPMKAPAPITVLVLWTPS